MSAAPFSIPREIFVRIVDKVNICYRPADNPDAPLVNLALSHPSLDQIDYAEIEVPYLTYEDYTEDLGVHFRHVRLHIRARPQPSFECSTKEPLQWAGDYDDWSEHAAGAFVKDMEKRVLRRLKPPKEVKGWLREVVELCRLGLEPEKPFGGKGSDAAFKDAVADKVDEMVAETARR